MRYLEIKENYYLIYSSDWRTKKKNKEKHDYLMIHSTNSLHNIMLTNSTTQKYRFMKQSMLLKFTACGAEQRTSKLGSSGAGWSIFELFGQKDKSTNREPGAQNRWKRKKMNKWKNLCSVNLSAQNRGGRVTRKKHKKKKEYPQHWWVGGGTMAQAVVTLQHK